MHRLRLVLALVAALLVAAPAAAMADGESSGLSASFTGPKFQGYSLTGFASPGASHETSGLSFDLTKQRGKTASQTHSFSAKKASVTIKSLKSATASTSMRNMKAKLTFHPRGRTKKAPLPPGCKGTPGKMQPGTFTGNLRIAVGRGFGTIKLGSIAGQITQGGTITTCRGGEGGHISVAGLSSSRAGLNFDAFRAGRTGSVSFSVFGRKPVGGVYMSHSLFVPLRKGALKIGRKLKTASVSVSDPWASGVLKFTSKGCTVGGFAQGTVKGNINAKFDILGNRRFMGKKAPAGVSVSPTPNECKPPPDKTPPKAAFTASQTETRLDYQFDGSNSSDASGIRTYAWNFGDPGSGNQNTVSGPSSFVNHHFSAAGPHTVKLTVTDTAGNKGSVTHTVTIAANQPPTATFGAGDNPCTVGSQNCFAGSDSGFSVTANDNDGNIVSYVWTFGDGSPAVTTSDPSVSHTYATPGQYTLSVKVTDNDGASTTASTTVEISPSGG